MIAAAFYPKPVIIRLSHFKTNEYAELIGGAAFEPREANPMLGFCGASRYAHPAYADGFASGRSPLAAFACKPAGISGTVAFPIGLAALPATCGPIVRE